MSRTKYRLRGGSIHSDVPVKPTWPNAAGDISVPHDDVGRMVSQPSARELPGTSLLRVARATRSGVSGAGTDASPRAARSTSPREAADGVDGAEQAGMPRDAAERRRVIVVNLGDQRSPAPHVFLERHRGRGDRMPILWHGKPEHIVGHARGDIGELVGGGQRRAASAIGSEKPEQFADIAARVTDDVFGFAVPQESGHCDHRAHDAARGRRGARATLNSRGSRQLRGGARRRRGACRLVRTGSLGGFARAVLRAAHGDTSVPAPFSPELVARATRRSAVPGARARSAGTRCPVACGTEKSPAAFGHVGFTGTSLWIHPPLNRYSVLLTNRVYGGSTSEEIRRTRAFHNTLVRLQGLRYQRRGAPLVFFPTTVSRRVSR